MKLHYSQTDLSFLLPPHKFYSPMKLHYSQTVCAVCAISSCLIPLWNYTTLKRASRWAPKKSVWFPYEITLLSNVICANLSTRLVWFPYEIILLSNRAPSAKKSRQFDSPMKLHYSQTSRDEYGRQVRFDSPMKLHYSQTVQPTLKRLPRLIPLWNYTTLKHECVVEH